MKVELPKAFQELLTAKARYKMFYGGRAGGKSFAFADALLTLATSRKMLIACVREVQNSIKDSVYKLIADRIAYYRLGDYRLYDDRIVNLKNKSKFIFKGIMEHNAQNIKSLEGVDICWCEEAQKISERAWLVLDPTIRKPGSEIWLSLNREEEADPVWKALALHPDADTIVRKVNYYDNPYCPENMRRLAAKMKAENYGEYLHVWEGEPRLAADDHLIGREEVYRALEARVEIADGAAPLIVGVDVARFGDDKTALCRTINTLLTSKVRLRRKMRHRFCAREAGAVVVSRWRRGFFIWPRSLRREVLLWKHAWRSLRSLWKMRMR